MQRLSGKEGKAETIKNCEGRGQAATFPIRGKKLVAIKSHHLQDRINISCLSLNTNRFPEIWVEVSLFLPLICLVDLYCILLSCHRGVAGSDAGQIKRSAERGWRYGDQKLMWDFCETSYLTVKPQLEDDCIAMPMTLGGC